MVRFYKAARYSSPETIMPLYSTAFMGLTIYFTRPSPMKPISALY
jgi:hypothetical protein